jgi:hypothetical protein
MDSTDPEDKTVRFSSVKQEISPEQSFQSQTTVPGREPRDDIPEEAQEELRNLAMTLQKSRLQSKRMGDFAFDPVSLPVSRVSFSRVFTASAGSLDQITTVEVISRLHGFLAKFEFESPEMMSP